MASPAGRAARHRAAGVAPLAPWTSLGFSGDTSKRDQSHRRGGGRASQQAHAVTPRDAPKAKRPRLEAVKKLDFGIHDELLPDFHPDAVASPAAPAAPQSARGMAFSSLDHLGMSDMVPLQTTPPSEKSPKRVLKRPPILEDYVNVTSTEGTRVFLVLREDCSRTGVELPDSLGWNAQRPLYLLGVPFSYLKEQVYEERRRQVLEASQQLTEIINSCLESQVSDDTVEPREDAGRPEDEQEASSHCLWVDRFTPRRYTELLSDDYTNRCLLKWLKLWDTVVFGKEKPVKKVKPNAGAHPPLKQPKEQQNKWKSKVQLTEEILEAELDQYKRPKYKAALLCGPPGLGKYVPSLRPLREQIALRQGMKADTGALLALCEKTENDIRSCINTLQFLHGRGQKELSMQMVQTMKIGLKDQNKGLFSIWQEIFRLPKVQRHRIGMDPALPSELLGVDDGLLHAGAKPGFNAPSHRFHRILHLATAAGEHEKLAQGLYDNFLNMRMRDSCFGSMCLALEWLEFSDMLGSAVLHGQSFQLLRYLPFLPVAFHLLFAASSIPRLAYPNSQHEALAKLNHKQNLVMALVSGIAPGARSRAGMQVLVLEVLCLLLDIIAPKLRPVNTQLYSLKEKQQLAALISTMLAYNLTYHQERTPEGHYVYKLDPNVEDVCRFPDLPARRQLTYQAKQLIAREIELEKMRRTEALLQERKGHEVGTAGPGRGSRGRSEGEEKPQLAPLLLQRNHEQRLELLVRRGGSGDKPETDFFGRPLVRKAAAPAPASQPDEQDSIEKQMGTAVGRSDVWFRFNEGVSNAVRRNIYIKDLL
ncbi:PREDICTED: chromosome transmission fidelity protein 18 homolog [Tinamus guttatus]|uniref:chromosome transmission fidelity protein 18 homolog n=1 Tax=Tinamus guttatus TaxID=94827 RepID=UPI00052E9A56|nr:PREDICTED: chromosome transmission fidelity protein 18 homolog [Tinamus guttatus]